MTTQELVASKLEELGNKITLIETGPNLGFKKKAYLKAAAAIRNFPCDITAADQLEGVPGIGKGIMDKVDEIILTGTLKRLAALETKGTDYSGLLKVQGVGPVKAKELFDTYKVRNAVELLAKIKDGTIQDKPDQLEKLKRSAERAILIKGERMPLAKAEVMTADILFPLQLKVPTAIIQVTGSIRRKKATVKDVDMVFCGNSKECEEGRKVFLAMPWDYVELAGDTRITAVKDGYGVDIRFVSKDQYGSTVLYFTGSGQFNVQMRAKAKEMGYKLNEYGLFKDDVLIASKREQDIFAALGMPYVPPNKEK
jgi:DNA polymerase (family 10)